jgi:hypothetical protein
MKAEKDNTAISDLSLPMRDLGDSKLLTFEIKSKTVLSPGTLSGHRSYESYYIVVTAMVLASLINAMTVVYIRIRFHVWGIAFDSETNVSSFWLTAALVLAW